MRMTLLATLLPLLCLPLLGCPPSGDDDDDANGDGSGVITYTLDGATYTETQSVNASMQSEGTFVSIGWGSAGEGDLGADFMGSLTLSEFDGVGTYAPVERMSIIDAVIGVGTEAGAVTYYPLGQGGGAGDGSIEVTEASDTATAGTFAFTGEIVGQPGNTTPITGSFDVIFAIPDAE